VTLRRRSKPLTSLPSRHRQAQRASRYHAPHPLLQPPSTKGAAGHQAYVRGLQEPVSPYLMRLVAAALLALSRAREQKVLSPLLFRLDSPAPALAYPQLPRTSAPSHSCDTSMTPFAGRQGDAEGGAEARAELLTFVAKHRIAPTLLPHVPPLLSRASVAAARDFGGRHLGRCLSSASLTLVRSPSCPLAAS
jgi:hypothetical protein